MKISTTVTTTTITQHSIPYDDWREIIQNDIFKNFNVYVPVDSISITHDAKPNIVIEWSEEVVASKGE